MNNDIQQSFQKPLTSIDKDTWKNLWSEEGKRKLVAGCIVRIFLQLTGINLAINYADIFRFTEKNSHFDLRFFIAFASMVYTFTAMYLLKVVKRKTLLLIGILIS